MDADLVAIFEHPKHLKHTLDVIAGRKESMEATKGEDSALMIGLANLSEMDIEGEKETTLSVCGVRKLSMFISSVA